MDAGSKHLNMMQLNKCAIGSLGELYYYVLAEESLSVDNV